MTRDDVESAAALQLAGSCRQQTRVQWSEAIAANRCAACMRSMAAAMTESAATIPAVTEWVEVDVTPKRGPGRPA